MKLRFAHRIFIACMIAAIVPLISGVLVHRAWPHVDNLVGFSLVEILLVGAVMLAASGGAAWWLGRGVRRARDTARAALDQFARGGVSGPATWPADELGELLDDMYQRLHEFSVLRESSLDVSGELDMPRLLQTVTERASSLLDVSGVYIYEADPAQKKLLLRAAVGRQTERLEAKELAYGEGALGRVAETGQWLAVNDYPNWPGQSVRFAGQPIFNLLAIPLVWQGQLIGALSVEDEAGGRPFTDRDAALAQQLAQRAAMAISNARLYAAAGRQARRLEILHQASQAINHSLDLEAVYQAIYQAVGQLMPNEAFAITLADEAHHQIATVFLVDQGQRRENQTLAWGTGLAGHLLQTGQPLLLNSASEWPQGVQHFGHSASVQSVLATPLRVSDRLLGTLATQSYRPNAFSQEDLPLLVLLSNQAAPAIQNARLFHSVRRQLSELSILQEVARAAVSTSDLDQMIERAIQALRQHSGYDVLGLFLLDAPAGVLHLHESFATMFPGQQAAQTVALGRGLVGQAASSGQLQRTGRREADAPRLAADTESAVCAPLSVGKRIIGVITAEAAARDAFRDADERLLSIVAGLLAPMIDNVRLYARDRRRLGELSLLNETTLAAVSAPGFDALVAQALQVLQQRLGYEFVSVGICDETGQWIRPHPASLGVPDLEHREAFHVSQGLVGVAVQTGRAVRVQDVHQDPRYLALMPEVQSQLVVPLKVADRVIGVLNVESRRSAAFGETDEQLLTFVAGLLAPIMETARLRARAEKHARELDLLYQAQLATATGVDPGQALSAIIAQVGRALDLSQVYAVQREDDRVQTIAEYALSQAAPPLRELTPRRPFPPDMFAATWEKLAQGKAGYLYPGDETLSDAERQYLRQQGGQALLVVPLTRQGRLVGCLELWEDRRPRLFSDEDEHLAHALAGHAAAAIENAKLYRAAQRRAEQMRLINQVSQAAAGILDVDELLDKVSQSLEQAFGYYHVNVGWLEAGEVVFRDRYNRRRGVTIPGVRFPVQGPGIAAWVAQNAQPRLVSRVDGDPLYVPEPYFPHVQSQLVVPLLSHGKLIGVLDVLSDMAGALTEDDLTALEAISGQLAVAVENAHLYVEARQRAEEVSILLSTTVTMSSSINLDRRLDSMARFARRLVDADSCIIYKLEAQEKLLRPLVVHDRYAEEIQSFTLPLGDGIAGLVALTGKGELINRVELDPRAKQIPGTPLTPESMIAVPLKVGERITGVMAVYREGLREFSNHDLNLISSFASQAATAIENAELYQALEQRADSLQAAYDELAEMDRLKDEMVQNVSHELRSPITFLKSYVDLLLSGQLGALQPEQERSLRVVAEKTQVLIKLVEDILTLQVVSPETLKLQRRDLAAMAREAADGVAAAVMEAGLQLESEIPDQPIWVDIDPARLSQVFDNLLGNAVKFTERGGRIQLLVRLSPGQVRVDVRDTGIGISTDNLKRVFERFYQVDGTRARRRGGMGLGLAICKRIVESHGGQMGVESQQNSGSTFYFVLPVKPGG